ncbi:MAG: ABC transporter ATP-binding protein [Candidatus Izemoplasmatales bacterium]
MNIIEVENITKKFDDFIAVNSISFAVKKGEIFGFLGPNGAGKTTTINMLTGLAKPSSGSIMIAEKNGIKDIKKVQSLIGIVPDESNLYDDLNGFDNLVFCASLYGIGKEKREKRAKELLKNFSLDDTGKRLFKNFSKGMKRKLTIAAGIIHEPEILFLDEPTTGIDVESARQIRKMIKNLNDQGTTIFLTTHYIEDAERLCDRIAFIVGGEVNTISPVNKLMEETEKDYKTRFTIESQTLSFLDDFKDEFKDVNVLSAKDGQLTISYDRRINLMRFMNFFEKKNIIINEAKIIKPTLEEVFVKITGIEIDKLKEEREVRSK